MTFKEVTIGDARLILGDCREVMQSIEERLKHWKRRHNELMAAYGDQPARPAVKSRRSLCGPLPA